MPVSYLIGGTFSAATCVGAAAVATASSEGLTCGPGFAPGRGRRRDRISVSGHPVLLQASIPRVSFSVL